MMKQQQCRTPPDTRLESFEEDPEETNRDDGGSVLDIPEQEKVSIGTNESKAVWYLRLILIAVIVIVAIGVSAAVFFITSSNEQEDFEAQYAEHARTIVLEFQSNVARRMRALDNMAFAISSYAVDTDNIWPFVTIPHFEQLSQYSLDLADVISVTLLPIVTNETRLDWETYSVENQGWLLQGLEVQALQNATAATAGGGSTTKATDNVADDAASLALLDDIDSNSADLQIHAQITRIDGTGSVNETGPGPFVPWWQFAPAFPYSAVVNYNTLSHPTRVDQIKTVMQTSQTLISKAWDYHDTEDPETVGRKAILNLFLNRWRQGGNSYQDGPVSDVYVPIFDQVDVQAPKQLVAMLTAYVYWQLYFENLLPDNAHGILAILENVCANDLHQSFTYLINGKKAEYVGPGDLHDPKYDYLEVSTGYPAFLQDTKATLDNLMDGQCLYNVRVYPTQYMEDSCTSSTPGAFTLVIAATFVFTSLVFTLYDYLVERRQQVVLKTAVQSTQVVNTLFPETVRNRLYEENAKSDDGTGVAKKLGEFGWGDVNAKDTSVGQGAIADVYNNCTVLFADIAGFTKWSHGREPTQVFQLLEAIYGAFDRIARKRRVFKIETIGDSYLAVTGLPNPQRDHAVLMAKFASECITQMNQLLHSKLVHTLGEDILELKMRFGLHSGSVTAGVLRGERARFQLFGDTVNTASRMESTGVPGKIQASMATADLLVAAGKEAWIVPRDEEVEAKGKGMLRTVWINPSFNRPASVSSFYTHSKSMGSHDSSAASGQPQPHFGVDLPDCRHTSEDVGSSEVVNDKSPRKRALERMTDFEV